MRQRSPWSSNVRIIDKDFRSGKLYSAAVNRKAAFTIFELCRWKLSTYEVEESLSDAHKSFVVFTQFTGCVDRQSSVRLKISND
jgi:hypothetical protein